MLDVQDWCVGCTGLVCWMYWTGVLDVLDWCVGLVYRKFWTSVFYVLTWCVHKNIIIYKCVVCTVVCTGRVCCMS